MEIFTWMKVASGVLNYWFDGKWVTKSKRIVISNLVSSLYLQNDNVEVHLL